MLLVYIYENKGSLRKLTVLQPPFFVVPPVPLQKFCLEFIVIFQDIYYIEKEFFLFV